MFKFKASIWSWTVLFILGLIFINYFGSQDQFTSTLLVYALLFAIYLYFIRTRKNFTEKTTDYFALIFHLVPLFAIPSLSPDIYRFIWDGEILTHGIHPYAYTPQELTEQSFYQSNEYLKSLYSEITGLSRKNYSLYPTVNQFYFVIPAYLTENLFLAVLLMKVLVLATAVLGYVYLKKILRFLKIATKNAWLIAINPFIIIELTGNLHFEGVMLSFLFVAFYFVLTKKWLIAALFWAIAINIKLTPIILLPFLLRFVGWRSALKTYFLVGSFSIALLSIYLWPSVFPNFMSSIELYFNNFEFNSSLFSIVEYMIYPVYDYKTILVVGPLLSKIGVLIICLIAIIRPINTGRVWFERMSWGYLIYLLFATTVHPWYIVFPLGLSIFTKNTFIIAWSFLIMLSYGFYAFENKFISNGLIVAEYIGLLIFVLLDLTYRKRQHFFQRFLRL